MKVIDIMTLNANLGIKILIGILGTAISIVILGVTTSIVILGTAISIGILGAATLIAVLEDSVNLEDLYSGDSQVACLGTHCFREMGTLDIRRTATLLTGIRHMAINHTGITVLIKNENTLSKRISDCLACFHLSDSKTNNESSDHCIWDNWNSKKFAKTFEIAEQIFMIFFPSESASLATMPLRLNSLFHLSFFSLAKIKSASYSFHLISLQC
jgi:hypothetical protein